jgi:hypothetical protein
MDRELVAQYLSQLRDSFPFFLKELWRNIGLPYPHAVQLDIADFLQNGPHRLLVRGFRGMAKTWITAAFCDWELLRDCTTQITLSSAGEDLSIDTLRLMRNWLTLVPFLNHMAPMEAKTKGLRDAAKKFDVIGAPQGERMASVRAIGITGHMPGGRAHVLVADDVETNQNTVTREQRVALRTRFEGYEHLMYPDRSRIIVLGSPQHEDSLYDHLADEYGYSVRTYPMVYPEASEKVPHLAPMLRAALDEGERQPGDPIWPERFGLEVILERKALCRTTWLMQYMLVSNLSEANRYPLKLSDFIVNSVGAYEAPTWLQWGLTDHSGSTSIEDIPSVGFGADGFHRPTRVAQEWIGYHGVKAVLDPAGGGTRNPDEMAWAIGGQLHGFLHVKFVDGLTGGATQENLERLVTSLRRHGAQELHVETNFGGDMLAKLLTPIIERFTVKKSEEFPNGWACAILPYHAVGQKEVRIIDALEPVMNQHRLVIDPEVARDTVLMRQLTRVTRERGCLEHDDRLEVLAMLAKAFADDLQQDAYVMTDRHDQQKREDALLKWYAEAAEEEPRRSWIAV